MLNYYICNANAGWEQELDLGVFSEAAQCLDDEMTSNKRNFIVEQKMFCITFHHLGSVVFFQDMIYALYTMVIVLLYIILDGSNLHVQVLYSKYRFFLLASV